MTNTGKALIIGLVLIDLAVVAYLLVPRGERTKAENGTVVTDTVDAERPLAPSTVPPTPSTSTNDAAPISPRTSDTHVAGGSVQPDAPAPTANTGAIAAAPLPPHQASAHAGKTVAAHTPIETKNARPATPAMAATVQPNAHASTDVSRQGSNAVAAAMTAALVKESAKPDPSLPMPAGALQAPSQSSPQSPPQSQTPPHDGQYSRGSNPVAAAITQELVRQSAHVDPVSQPAVRGGAQ